MAQRFSDHPQPAPRAVSQSRAAKRPALASEAAIVTLRLWLTYPAWAVILVTLAFALLFPAQALHWQFVPFVLGMVVLGLPHGALDHLAPLFVLHRRLTPGYLTLFVLGYLALVAAYLGFWHSQPLGALVLFLLFSWLHWGQGDAYFLEVFEQQPPPRSVPGRLLIWIVRGGLPIVLPPLAHPAALTQVAGGILGWYARTNGLVMTAAQREAGISVLGLLALLYLWQSWRLSRREFGRDAGEIGLLTVYFLVVPPILAVGVYFCVWHAARHIARLMRLDEANRQALEQGQIGSALLRSAKQALPMTLGALSLLAGLFWWSGRPNVSVGGLVYLYLSLIAALTFPHFLLVLWMDRKERGQHHADPIGIGKRRDLLSDGL